jgi:translation initiation factor 1 (eIF-1/SUI1)
MAEEREILKYELDLTEFEAKVARVAQLTEQLKTKRAAGADTAEVEQQIVVEVQGLERVAAVHREVENVTRKGGTATEELIRSKQKLASVVSLVGGQFGGEIGHLANLVALFTTAGPLIAAVAAGLAGLGGLVQVFRSIAEEVKKANAELEKFNAGVRSAINEKSQGVEQIEKALLGFGALGPGMAESTYRYALGLQRLGIPEDLALQVATQAKVSGANEKAAALVAIASTAPGGEIPKTPAEFAAAARRVENQGDVRDTLEQQLAALRASGIGRRAAGFAALWEKVIEEDRPRWNALFTPDRDAIAVEFGKQLGIVPQKAGPDSVRKWRAKQAELRQQAQRGGVSDALELLVPAASGEQVLGQAFPGPVTASTPPHVWKQLELLDRLSTAMEALDETLQSGAAARVPAGRTGAGYVSPERVFPKGGKVRAGVIPADQFDEFTHEEGGKSQGALRPVVNHITNIGTQFNGQGDRRGRDLRTKFGTNSGIDIVSLL